MGNKNYEKFKLDEIRDKVAILLGQTGVGKSSFINCITNKKVCKVGDKATSCTRNVLQVDTIFNGFNYYLVDTPGLDDGKGDEKNIKEIESLKSKYPRINALIICLKFQDKKLCKSLKTSLKKFMEMFPSDEFWKHVLILRTHSERSSKFEKNKKNLEGILLEGIVNDKEMIDFMKEKGISMPTELKEFFVDSDPDDLDDGTKNEFKLIFNAISNIHPFYKEVTEEIKEYVKETKENGFSFINIKTEKTIKLTDFDGKKHQVVQIVGDENYNLDGIRPLLIEVKREQEKSPRLPLLCWSYQFKTHYYLIKFYQLSGERKRVQSELEWHWEYKDEEGKEIPGEERRQELDKIYNKNTCKC